MKAGPSKAGCAVSCVQLFKTTANNVRAYINPLGSKCIEAHRTQGWNWNHLDTCNSAQQPMNRSVCGPQLAAGRRPQRSTTSAYWPALGLSLSSFGNDIAQEARSCMPGPQAPATHFHLVPNFTIDFTHNFVRFKEKTICNNF